MFNNKIENIDDIAYKLYTKKHFIYGNISRSVTKMIFEIRYDNDSEYYKKAEIIIKNKKLIIRKKN